MKLLKQQVLRLICGIALITPFLMILYAVLGWFGVSDSGATLTGSFIAAIFGWYLNDIFDCFEWVMQK